MNSIIDAIRKNWARHVLEAIVITFSIIGAFMLDNLHNVDRNIKLNEQNVREYIETTLEVIESNIN